jgi:predicted nucleic acid-binding protein
MSAVFADTFNPNDELHQRAREQTEKLSGPFITTEWVLLELANYLRKTEQRQLFTALYDDLRHDGRVTIVPVSSEVFEEGVDRYKDRPDKDWSLTNCISFLLMEQNAIDDALAADHHFEQAGFKILLSD